MALREYVKTEKFKHIWQRIIHEDLKNAFVFTASKAIKLLPKNYVCDSYDKLPSDELKKQWIAIDSAIDYVRNNDSRKRSCLLNKEGKLKEEFQVMRTAYFTAICTDGFYMQLVSRFLHEYATLKGYRK